MKLSKRYGIGVAAMAALWLGGCGGGTTDGGATASQQTGYLVDAAVEGVDYNGTAGSQGTTGADGSFSFRAGEKVEFRLGSFPLGAVAFGESPDGVTITPVDLVKGAVGGVPRSEDLNDSRVVTMLRLLQTADDNQNPEDGIRITSEDKTALSASYNGTGGSAESVGNALDRPVVSQEEAVAHFRRTIEAYYGTDVTDSGGDGAANPDDEADDNGSVSPGTPDDPEDNATVGDDGSRDGTTGDGGVDAPDDDAPAAGDDGTDSPDVGGSDEEHSDTESPDIGGSDTEGSDSEDASDGSSTDGGTSGGGTVTTGSGAYTLLAWNDLGMHCMDGKDFSVFSILPPYNTVNAQLIKKAGTSNKHVTSGVTVTYRAAASLDGKYNTTSLYNDSGDLKTNFWDFVGALFNAHPAPDTGLTGNHTPDLTEHAFSYNGTNQWWEAVGLPITPYNDDGSKNYYPMVDVVAKDGSGNVLATTTVVLPVSDEMDCRACHGSASGYAAAMPDAGWENDADPEKDYKWNILRLHDQEHPAAVSDHQPELQAAGYNGYDSAGLYTTAKNGNPVLCATCHSTNALGTAGVSGTKPLTEALHSLHAEVEDPVNGLTLNSSTNRESCYRCHPGATTKCLRGAMGKQSNIQCQSCHGSMSAVGAHGRSGWQDEPNCQACHQDGKRYDSAVTDMQAGTLRAALDSRFATNANTLYRFSSGHGDMQCSACHGSTHAIYPSSHAEDNLQSIAVQGHEGTIAECTACHDTVPRTTSGGPHGMHSVGQYWVGAHGDVAESSRTSCKNCHGTDYRGSFLSRTSASRSFSTEWGTKSFGAGHAVSCYDCHNGPSGD